MAITLIVEDGSGVENANSYIDAAYMSQYAELQGSSDWCNNTDQQTLALVQASQFIDLRYSARFCGELVHEDQGLLFPRIVNGVNSGIPKSLKNAVASLALQYLQDGGLDLNANADASVKAESISLGNGAIVESKTYYDNESAKASFSNFAVTDRYVDQLMKTVGCGGASSSLFIPAYRG